MSQIFAAHRTVCTRGTYMGEEGTGYGWGELEEYGDFSRATRGHLQGYTEPCKIEVFDDQAQLQESQGGEMLLYTPAEGLIRHTESGGYPLPASYGLTASEAIAFGLARVLEEEE